jgi:Family of unknown function (DUF6335)
MKDEISESYSQQSDTLDFDEPTSMDLAEIAPEVEALHLMELDEDYDGDIDLGDPQDLSDESAPTGGDVDVDPYLADVVGEEAIGGTTPTPDQNVVDDLGTSAGIEIPDQGILHTTEMLERRNDHRWELEPESAEDFGES